MTSYTSKLSVKEMNVFDQALTLTFCYFFANILVLPQLTMQPLTNITQLHHSTHFHVLLLFEL